MTYSVVLFYRQSMRNVMGIKHIELMLQHRQLIIKQCIFRRAFYNHQISQGLICTIIQK